MRTRFINNFIHSFASVSTVESRNVKCDAILKIMNLYNIDWISKE